ncbi:hypothetical protein EVAR_71884_1, partial [Eumeta japonica]
MALLKVLELFSKVLPLVLLLKLFISREVAALHKMETLKLQTILIATTELQIHQTLDTVNDNQGVATVFKKAVYCFPSWLIIFR